MSPASVLDSVAFVASPEVLDIASKVHSNLLSAEQVDAGKQALESDKAVTSSPAYFDGGTVTLNNRSVDAVALSSDDPANVIGVGIIITPEIARTLGVEPMYEGAVLLADNQRSLLDEFRNREVTHHGHDLMTVTAVADNEFI